VLDVFRDANEPLTPKSVTEQLESVTNSAGGVTVTVTLFALCGSQNPQQNAENGDLVRLKFGKYTLPQGQCHTVTVPGENDPDGRSVKV
jgi:hypothetical protein